MVHTLPRSTHGVGSDSYCSQLLTCSHISTPVRHIAVLFQPSLVGFVSITGKPHTMHAVLHALALHGELHEGSLHQWRWLTSDACCLQAQGSKLRPRALRLLAQEQLGLSMQGGEHNPVDDARACLYLYLKHRKVGLAGWAAHPPPGAVAMPPASQDVLPWEVLCCVCVCCRCGPCLQN